LEHSQRFDFELQAFEQAFSLTLQVPRLLERERFLSQVPRKDVA
jgi:hypothetical protein